MDPAISRVLSQCYPFNEIDLSELDSQLAGLKPRLCKRGQPLLRSSGRADTQLTYLVTGAAELRRSFFDRQPLQAGEESALQPLDNLLPAQGGQIVALDDCNAVHVPRAVIDRVLELRAQRERLIQAELLAGRNAAEGPSSFEPGDVVDVNLYGVRPLSDSDLSDDFRVSDAAVEVDWMSRFLQSPLAHHLPATGIQQLLACLQVVDVARGDAIIRRGEPGDAMYVLHRGVASVRTDREGTFDGQEIPLIPGDYFGEESLVADTVRNADVVMESDGAVARLDRDAFRELIYPHLVPVADVERRQAAWAGHDSVQVIDVRLPLEYRRQAIPGSRNIPISVLRGVFDELDRKRACLITDCGGRRSELAVFLLRQAGFDAWLLTA